MGGDHKCPVCQATFTRPQHVARHMRSHTGDRPYKCQHCGDQFARSDLLSRHVNKCHANEKPLPSTGNARRKGSASVSRAITSKQACDQCVQSSLPCDGCNPCAKCVQRKCRCTFVKFHRQTAPAGPGHNPRPSSSSARLSGYPSSDDFMLGAAPLDVGPTIPDIYSQQFSFPQLSSDAPDPSISVDNTGNVGPPIYPQQTTSSWLGWSDLQATLSRHIMDQQVQQQLMSNLGQEVPGQNAAYPPVMQSQNHPSHQGPPGEGGFSSAFGLMSLEDPNVLAGLSNDGAPYFSANMSMYPEDPNATPMPAKQGSANQRSNNFGPSSSSMREAEMRELREFWKTYMRTPLSGPASALDPDAHAGTHQRRPSTPSSAPRRVRVNSLPSAKTPTAEGAKPYYPNGANNGAGANATSSMRTTLHGNGVDLRSYEAAVLARKTPTLHLAPPRRRGTASVQGGGPVPPGAAVQGYGARSEFSRPASASAASSLAGAFGRAEGPGPSHHAALGGVNMGTRRSPPSRESSLSLTSEDSTSDMETMRPSFKRLPSQTLGPAKSKRALLSHRGDDGEGAGDRDMEGGGGGMAMGDGHGSGDAGMGKGVGGIIRSRSLIGIEC